MPSTDNGVFVSRAKLTALNVTAGYFYFITS